MRVEFYLVLLVLAVGSALLFGTRGERWVAATVLTGNALTGIVERLTGESFSAFSFGYLALDAVLAVILCLIAVRYPSWVAVCVAAFQINGTLAHLVKFMAAPTIPFSYAFLLKVWAWPMVGVLLIARGLPPFGAILLRRNWPPFRNRV